MRNQDLKEKYMRISKIPEQGYLVNGSGKLEEKILKDSEIAAKDSLARYGLGPTSKPGTIPHNIALKVLDLVQRISNPNAIDKEMFRGSANRERDVISMVSRLFGKNNDDDLEAGYLLSGGTESLNQVTYMLRNKYFIENLNTDVRKAGLAEAIFQASKERLQTKGELIKPRILIPVNYHFAGVKGTDLLGLGTNNLAFYDVDKNFDIDEDSLRATIKSIYEKGDDIMYSLAVAGDTPRGKVHNIRNLSNIMEELAHQHDKKSAPIVIDAAGSYMFIGMMKDSEKYDSFMPEVSFNIDNVEAIVGDPHKQPLPYSCGLLMLKDMGLANYSDFRRIGNSGYLDMDDQSNRDTAAAMATLPTSRSGSNAFAVWAYMVYQGMDGLRKEKEKIWSLVKDFSEYVKESKFYEPVCQPQTQVVPFKFKGTGKENIDIYKKIKNSDKDFCYISQDEQMMVRTNQELNRSMVIDTKEYAGLFATVMEHNTQKDMDKLKERLEEEAFNINKRKSPMDYQRLEARG